MNTDDTKGTYEVEDSVENAMCNLFPVELIEQICYYECAETTKEGSNGKPIRFNLSDTISPLHQSYRVVSATHGFPTGGVSR